MSRYIDADALKKQWTIASPEPFSTDAAEVIDSIDNAPTVDAVAVVRCKDCKHAEPYKRTDGATGYYCHCKYNVFEYGDRRKYTPVRESGDYCSCGERRTGNG